MRTERSEPTGLWVVEGGSMGEEVVSSMSNPMSMTVGVTDFKAAISGVTTLGHKGFDPAFEAGLMIKFDSIDP